MGPSDLTDAEYHRLSSELLARVEGALDAWLQDDVIDIDAQRTGGLLEMSFPDGSKMVINTQPPLHEVWLASRAGGYHFRRSGGRWVDTKDGMDFYSRLSREASAQSGRSLHFSS
jgi:CyaY protein